MATTKNILRIEATPSTQSLHKYLVIVKKNNKKDTVMTDIQQIFRQMQGPLENQPANFPIPRCGGSEKKKLSILKPDKDEEINKSTNAYMVSLETLALANNPQDAGRTLPPKRYRKFTISYANAAKAGILKTPSQFERRMKTKTMLEQSHPTQTHRNQTLRPAAKSLGMKTRSTRANQPAAHSLDH
jgi:hypothetical protein